MGRIRLTHIECNNLRAFSVPEPTRLYSPEQPIDTNLPPIMGIRSYGGPYDFLTDDIFLKRDFERIEVWGFYPKGYKEIGSALHTLLVNYLGEAYYGEKDDEDFYGFKDEFRVDFIVHDILEYEKGKLSDYIDSLCSELEKVQLGKSRVIAVVGGPAHRSVRENREYYLEAKRVFTNELNVPCQFASYYTHAEGRGILYKIARKARGARERGLGNAIWNFALDMYGKVGGIAWVVLQRTLSGKMVDLTIGLRFARAEKGYYIGCATIIDRFGRLVGVISQPSFKGEMTAEGMRVPKDIMQHIISTVIDYVKSDERIRGLLFNKNRTINIVVHRLFGFFDEEIEGIETALNSSVDNYNLGLVALITRPPIWAHNTKTSGIIRGRGYQISKNAALLYTISSVDDFTWPIGITVYRVGPFSSIEDVCSHVRALVALHWQTVIPHVRLPASVEFAEKIAHLYVKGIKPREGSWLWRTLWFI